jgi:proteasome lid subunit RPN8/RPN11
MTSSTVEVEGVALASMVLVAVAAEPLEMCGVLTVDGDFVEVANVARSEVMYCMDPHQQLDIWPWLDWIVHSHTLAEAYPSQNDVRLSMHERHIIVSLSHRQIRAFAIEGGVVTEQRLVVSGTNDVASAVWDDLTRLAGGVAR